jgi:hypothetical protein
MAVAVLVLGGFGAANAQLTDTAIKVNIPETFVIRGKVFQAGDYTIKRTDSTIDSPSLLLLQGDGGSVIFDTYATTSATAAKETKLVFEKAGDKLYLSGIWLKGDTVGNQVVGAKSEASSVAKITVKTGDVTTTTGF